jgi:ribosomal-protein-alanine N-acetyltransferase
MHAPGEKMSGSVSASVRHMSEADVSAVLRILEESPEASMWSGESLLESSSKGLAWVAEREGRVAGILIGQVAADEFEILNLAVGKEFRRRGAATQLVKAALEQARTAGTAKTYLEVRASNAAAISFYARMGFRVFGKRPNYYRNPVEDAAILVMGEDGAVS